MHTNIDSYLDPTEERVYLLFPCHEPVRKGSSKPSQTVSMDGFVLSREFSSGHVGDVCLIIIRSWGVYNLQIYAGLCASKFP